MEIFAIYPVLTIAIGMIVGEHYNSAELGTLVGGVMCLIPIAAAIGIEIWFRKRSAKWPD